MAWVDKYGYRGKGAPNDGSIEELIAHTAEAQYATAAAADRIYIDASVILAAHHHDGHATIEREEAWVDSWVILDDTRGLGAAMTIEFGREGGNTDRAGRTVSAMEPVAPLRSAMQNAKKRRHKKVRAPSGFGRR